MKTTLALAASAWLAMGCSSSQEPFGGANPTDTGGASADAADSTATDTYADVANDSDDAADVDDAPASDAGDAADTEADAAALAVEKARCLKHAPRMTWVDLLGWPPSCAYSDKMVMGRGDYYAGVSHVLLCDWAVASDSVTRCLPRPIVHPVAVVTSCNTPLLDALDLDTQGVDVIFTEARADGTNRVRMSTYPCSSVPKFLYAPDCKTPAKYPLCDPYKADGGATANALIGSAASDDPSVWQAD